MYNPIDDDAFAGVRVNVPTAERMKDKPVIRDIFAANKQDQAEDRLFPSESLWEKAASTVPQLLHQQTILSIYASSMSSRRH